MNLTKFFLLALVFSLATAAHAQLNASDQQQMKIYEDSLIVDGFLVVNDSLPERRFLATKKLILHLKSALKHDHSFDYHFDRLKSVSIQYPPDSSFRIFTWQLMVSPSDYRYFGVIQINQPTVKLIPLADRSDSLTDLAQAVTNPREWYGALYYNIQQITREGKPYYLLMGYDAYNLRDRRKVLEVLHFDSNGAASFGAPLIPTGTDELQHRLVLEYYGQSSVRLNYDPAMESIIYDHLIEIPGKAGQGPMMVPDGSYHALQLKAGELVFVDKLFNNQSVPQAPREAPVLGKSGRDIFGNQRGKN